MSSTPPPRRGDVHRIEMVGRMVAERFAGVTLPNPVTGSGGVWHAWTDGKTAWLLPAPPWEQRPPELPATPPWRGNP